MRRTYGKNILLFLSEYIEGHLFNTFELTREALYWISLAAQKCPHWFFIFKSRPYHHQDSLPGFELIKDIPNIIVPGTFIEYRNYLNWPNLKAVAACGSSGLFTAAGKGICALRLIVSLQSKSIPIIDNVATRIDSPQELIQILHRLEKKEMILPIINTDIFPNEGKVVEVMEKNCLERLNSG